MKHTESKNECSVVTATDISCSCQGRVILKDLSFQISSGAFLAFTGPNGVGKTTLLKTLCGLSQLPAGNISIPLEECIFLGHENGLKPELTTKENLQFWTRIFGHKIPVKAHSTFNINYLMNRQARHMSWGQKRKVALASAMFTRRKIWIFDEPTNGLDYSSVEEFSNLANNHCQRGGIVITATHGSFHSDICRYIELSEYSTQTHKIIV